MQFLSRLFILLVLFLGQACKENSKKDRIENASDSAGTSDYTVAANKQAQYTERVKAGSDSSTEYTIYLPASETAAMPVIYIFDPHGDVKTPVNKYKQLADKYGFILAGLHNSENGMAWDLVKRFSETFMDEIRGKYPVDTLRQYTMGFSGGARVASGMAIADGKIKGVIACSGGLPSGGKGFGYDFDFYGIAGEEDFNMTEMKALDEALKATSTNHYLSLFDGGHVWPETGVMEEAFLWHQLMAMKKHLLKENKVLIDSLTRKAMTDIDEKVKTGKKYEAFLDCRKWTSFLKDLSDINIIAGKGRELAADKEVIRQQNRLKDLAEQEIAMSRELWPAFREKDKDWWQKKVKEIRRQQKDKDQEKANMYKRIEGFISLAAYTHSHSALNAQRIEELDKYADLYISIDPANPEAYYLKAISSARMGEEKASISWLKKFVEKGFKDPERIKNERSFAPLSGTAEFKNTLKSITGA